MKKMLLIVLSVLTLSTVLISGEGKYLLKLTKNNFESLVLESKSAVMVDFGANWCGPCKTIGPRLEKLAKKYEGEFKIGKVNVDKSRDLAIKYKISSIPAVMVFKDGKIISSFVGLKEEVFIEKMILKYKTDSVVEKKDK